MKKVMMIEPPNGRKYGFPKEYPKKIVDWRDHHAGKAYDLRTWLVSEGYPQKEIDACGDRFFCRYWEVNSEDT